MTKYKVMYDLRSMLRAMEKELGLSDLSAPEQDVFLAAQSLTKCEGQIVNSVDIRNHPLVKDVAPATYHRALRALLDRGMLEKSIGAKTKSYVVANSNIVSLANAV